MNLLGVDPGRLSGFALVDQFGKLLALDTAEVPAGIDGFRNIERVLSARRFANLVGLAAIERPFVGARHAQSVIEQGAIYGMIRSAIVINFWLWPVDVLPQQTKIGLTGSGNAGAGRQKGVQKALMVAAAYRRADFVTCFERDIASKGLPRVKEQRALEACADAFGVALFEHERLRAEMILK